LILKLLLPATEARGSMPIIEVLCARVAVCHGCYLRRVGADSKAREARTLILNLGGKRMGAEMVTVAWKW
jgi:hypothetical protein